MVNDGSNSKGFWFESRPKIIQVEQRSIELDSVICGNLLLISSRLAVQSSQVT